MSGLVGGLVGTLAGGGSSLTAPRLPLREVLPDSTPATGTAVPPAPVPSNPSLRDSAFSSEFPGDCPCGRPSAVSPLSRTPVPQGALPLRPPDFLSFPSSFLLRGLSLLLFATFL